MSSNDASKEKETTVKTESKCNEIIVTPMDNLPLSLKQIEHAEAYGLYSEKNSNKPVVSNNQ